MKLDKVNIRYYRSIESITLILPKNKPLVLFGPNNAGKSNILSAVNRIIGERYPTYIEMLDSDYFQRDQNSYPTSEITARFSQPLYSDKWGNDYKTISVSYGYNGEIRHRVIPRDTFIQGNKFYSKIKEKKHNPNYNDYVYNFEVANDNSYT